MPRPRIALALSGGGFRASIFHLGVLQRIAELGWLESIDVISTVSGGSIIGAYLATKWPKVQELGCNNSAFQEVVVRPFLSFVTSKNFIREWIARSYCIPIRKIGDRTYTRTKLAGELLGEWFYVGKSCADLPLTPLLVLNATNLQSMRAWRFTRYGMGDSRIGHANWGDHPLPLGEAVGYSAAFPPVFTPGRIKRSNYSFGRPVYGERPLEEYPLIPLSDGGVYDNSALEAVWKDTKLPGIADPLQLSDFLIVSDAGAPPQYHFRSSGIPGWTDALLLYRADQIAREQVSALRRRALVSSFGDPAQSRNGLLIYIGSDLQRIPSGGGVLYARAVGPDVCIPQELVELIRRVRTHLDVFTKLECKALMYHAYMMADAFLWAHRNTCPPQYRVSDQPNPTWKIKFTGELNDIWASGLAESNRIRIF